VWIEGLLIQSSLSLLDEDLSMAVLVWFVKKTALTIAVRAIEAIAT
jgi:hypothetical protein